MNAFWEKHANKILPTLVALFTLTGLSLALAFNPAWAAPGTGAQHELTYTQNRLRWENPTKVDPATGVAELTLFDAVYGETVASHDGAKVVAPGTAGSNLVRLHNKVHGAVNYTAILYEIKTDPTLPVTPALRVSSTKPVTALTDLGEIKLPEGVEASQVMSIQQGAVPAGGMCDFFVDWRWVYDRSAAQDATDTLLGNKLKPDQVTMGLYIIVEDNNNYHYPMTGDNSNLTPYVGMLLGSVTVMLGVYLWVLRKQKAEETMEDGGECAG